MKSNPVFTNSGSIWYIEVRKIILDLGRVTLDPIKLNENDQSKISFEFIL
jgi:hypothetical protein